MTEETRTGFLANYQIVRPGLARPAQVNPGPASRAGPQFKNSARARPGPARPAFGPARLTPLIYNYISLLTFSRVTAAAAGLLIPTVRRI